MGQTALHIAVQTQQPDLVELLLLHSADVSIAGLQGETPLHLAARNANRKMVKKILAAGADVGATMLNGVTPLHCCCQSGDGAKAAKELLKKGAQMDAVRSIAAGTSGITPLHDAAEVGDLKTVRLLLDAGAEVDVETSTACTAFHIACKYGYLDLVKELIARGAYIAKMCNDSRGTSAQPIHWAVEHSQEDVVRALIEVSADVNASREYNSKSGVTCLHLAVMKNYLSLVRLLLELGAKVNARDEEGTTALHLSARGGFVEVTQLLLKNGADTKLGSSSKQSRDQTPLHYAVRFKHADIARLIIGAGCAVNAAEKMVVRANRTRMSNGGTSSFDTG